MMTDAIAVERNATAQLATAGNDSATDCGCSGASPDRFVYAVGRLEPRFPSLSLEKEFNQAAARMDTQGLSERQLHQSVFAQRENRYLLRQVCWVFSVQGLETYLLRLSDLGDHDLLVESLRERSSPGDIDVVVGRSAGLSSPSMCNGLIVPVIQADQLYSFDRESLLASLPLPDNMAREQFDASAQDVLERLILLTDNIGASDEHRALNYLSLRYAAIYQLVADAHARNLSLSGVSVQPSGLSQTRLIMEVVFSFTHRQTDVVEKYLVRVDVTEEFPFLVTKLSPYFNL
jgi:hypothetical protein